MLKQHNYRVLLADRVNGKSFNFAVHVKAIGLFATERAVRTEFPDADIIQIRNTQGA